MDIFLQMHFYAVFQSFFSTWCSICYCANCKHCVWCCFCQCHCSWWWCTYYSRFCIYICVWCLFSHIAVIFYPKLYVTISLYHIYLSYVFLYLYILFTYLWIFFLHQYEYFAIGIFFARFSSKFCLPDVVSLVFVHFTVISLVVSICMILVDDDELFTVISLVVSIWVILVDYNESNNVKFISIHMCDKWCETLLRYYITEHTLHCFLKIYIYHMYSYLFIYIYVLEMYTLTGVLSLIYLTCYGSCIVVIHVCMPSGFI